MNVLMLSTDRSILDPGSAAGKRLASYRSFADIRILLVERDFFKALREGKEILTDFKPDVVSAQDPFFVGLIGLLLARHAHARLHVQVHTDFMSAAYICESPKHFMGVLIAAIVLSRAASVRAVSARAASGARRFTRAPITVLPIRVNEAANSGGDPFPSRPVVLAASRFASEKRLHLVIDAVAAVPDVHLYIAGEGPERRALEARVRNHSIESRVHFVGFVDLAPYYHHADVYIQMSRYEGYGMALMEAALAGVPIVTTDVGVIGEAIPREAVTVVTSARSAADAIQAILREPLGAKARATRAKEAAQKSLMTESQYLDAYQKNLEVL